MFEGLSERGNRWGRGGRDACPSQPAILYPVMLGWQDHPAPPFLMGVDGPSMTPGLWQETVYSLVMVTVWREDGEQSG